MSEKLKCPVCGEVMYDIAGGLQCPNTKCIMKRLIITGEDRKLLNYRPKEQALQAALNVAVETLKKQEDDCETHYDNTGMSVFKVMAMDAEQAFAEIEKITGKE